MLLTALVAVLGAVCVASPAAASVTRGQAAAKAIAALGVKKGSAPVIVFRGSAPVAPGARIAEAGLSSANAASLRQSPAVRKMRLRNAGVRTAKAPTVARVGRNGAWFFYADKAPFKAYQHPGQVVLVDAETGKVTKTRTLMWPPLINGRLPAFMRSAAAYRSKTNYAFYRPYSAAASSFANAFAAAAPSLERSAATQQAADTLAAQHACAVRISDTLGDFYDFGNIDSTRAQLGLLFEGLEALNPGFISERYSTYSNRTPTGFIQHLVDTKGCKQILVYVAGGGIKGAHSTAVIGQSPHAGGTLDAQYLTSSAVARLIGANRGVEFDVLVDAPYSDGFATALAHQPNVALVLTPSGGAGPSFTFLPEIKTAKGLQQNTGNPAGLLEFTNRLLVGAGRFLSDPAEVQTAAAQTAAGFQAWMFGRAFQNSADVDFPAQLPPSDVAPPAQIETPSGVTPTPPPPTPPGPTTPVNTPPVATGQAVTTAEDTAKAVTLAGIDADSDPLTFAIATQPAHGALTGTGPNLTYTPEANYNGPDSFTFTTSDGHASSAPATVAITVTPVNDAPSAVGTDNSPLGYIDGAPAVAVWPTIALSDIDNADLAGATVAISSGRDPADQLQFTNQSGITGAFSAATGILTLTGSATKANYETALRSVAFASSGAATGQRSVTFVVSDGPATSAPIARTVFVDDAPTDIALTNTSVDENQPSGTTVGTLSSIDPDAGDSHTYSLVAGTGSADNGSFQINGTSLESNASFNYEAKSSYSIRVRSDDGHGGTFEKQFTISVADLNDAPTADAKTITGVTEDVAKAITLSGDDEDGNALTFSIVSGPAHGGLGAIAAPSCAGAPSHCSADVTYTPDPDYNGADSFTYKANDGTADSATKTVAITVDAVNDAPVASDGSASLNEDATKSVDLSALVTDVDNSVASLTYTIVSPPAHGGLTGSGVSRTYTPDADYNGPDSFTYKAGDGTDDSATKTVSITVDPVNDVPQASDTSVSLSEDGNKAIDLSALVSDLETSNANLTYTVVTPPAHGSYSGGTYTPDADFNGPDSFTYKVTDRGDPDNCSGGAPACAAPQTSATKTVSITVDPVNDGPVASDGSTSLNEDASKLVDIGALASDVETSDANLAYAIVGAPAHGGLTGSGSSRTYTPDANYNGPDSFTYKVTDRGDPDNCSASPCDTAQTSATKTVSITVDPVNDVPQASDTSVSLSEDGNKAIDLSALVSDLETSNANLTYTVVTPPAHGSYSGGTYTPDADFNGPDSFTYKVTDRGDPDNCGAPGAGCAASQSSATKTVSIAVDAVNDAPVNTVPGGTIKPVVDTDTPLSGISVNDVDAGSDDIQLSLTVLKGKLTLSTSVLGGIGALQVSGNGTPAVVVTASQSEINTTLADANGLVYRGGAGYLGADTLTVSTDDLGHNGAGGAQSDLDAQALQVVPPNDAPIASDLSPSTNEDTAKSVTLSATDDDGPSDLTFSIVTPPAHGGLGAIGSVGCDHASPNTCTASVTYTPDPDYNGSDGFTYKAFDGISDSNTASVIVTINAVNDAPTISGIEPSPLAYTENDPATPVTASASVADVDSTDLDTGTLTVDYTTGGTASDRLEFANQGTGAGQVGVSGSNLSFGGTTVGTFTGGTGTTPLVVTFNASATPAAAQGLVRDVTYRNVSDNPATAARTVRFVLTDGDGGTSAATTRGITLTAVNDAPVLAGIESTALAFTEGDPATALTSGLTVNDADSNLTGATVAITGNYGLGDALQFTDQLGITGSYNAGTGVLTLSGNTTPANYQTALRAVKFANTNDNPGSATRTITFQATDGDASNTQARDVAVTPVNDGPQVTTSGGSPTLAYTEDDPASKIDTGVTVSDPEGDSLAGATVQITSNYANGQDVLDLATVDTPVGITATWDPATGKLTLSGTASGASYQSALRAVTYVNTSEGPSPLLRTVTFKATDDQATTGPGATDSISVLPVNDPPTAVADSGATDQNTTLNASAPGVLGNDTDPDPGDTKTIVKLNGSSTLNGTSTKGAAVTINANGSYSYNPGNIFKHLPAGVDDTDTFTYTMEDAAHVQSTATVTITIHGLNDAPVANSDTFNGANSAIGNTVLGVSTSPASPAKTITGSVKTNDTDVDDSSTVTTVAETVSSANGGSATLNTDGSFTYTPPVGFTGSDTFTYHATDGTAQSAGTVTVDVANRVWYVDNSAAAGGDGRSTAPFQTLSAAQTATGTGDTVYTFKGNGSSYTAGITLKSSEQLVGEAQNLVVGGTTLFTGASGQRPSLAGQVALGSSSKLTGVAVTGSGSAAILGAAGTGGTTIDDVTVSGDSGGISLGHTSGTVTLANTTVSTTGGDAIADSASGGTVAFTPTGTIFVSSASGRGLNLQNAALLGTIDSVTTTSSANEGINLVNTTGSLTVDDINLTTTGTGLLVNGADSITVNNSGDADISSTGTAVNLENEATHPPSVSLDNVSGGGTAGVNIDSIGTGTFSATGGTLTGSTADVDINGGSGNITYPGTLANGSGLTLDMTNRTGGTVLLAGQITDTNDANGGINATANTGATLRITGSNNVIDSGSSTAVNVQNTTIGTGGLNFKTISANGGTNGIVLNTTGTTAGLTVAGDGSQTAGLLDRDGSGGTIQGTSQDAVLLTNAIATIKQLNITNAGWDGVQATGSGNVTLSAVDINHPGNAGPAANGSTGNPSGFGGGNGFYIENGTGTYGFDNNSRVINWQSSQSNAILLHNTNADFTSFTVDHALISTSATGAAGFHANLNGTTDGQVSLSNNEFTLIDQNAAQVLNNGSGTVRAIVQGNNFHDADATGGDGNNTLYLSNSHDGHLNFTIGGAGALGNTFHNLARLTTLAGVVQVDAAGGDNTTPAGGLINGTITNNNIWNDAGFTNGRRAIDVQVEADSHNLGQLAVAITNNTVNNVGGNAIHVSVVSVGGGSAADGNWTITGNSLGAPGTNNGIRVGLDNTDSASAIEFETNVDSFTSGADTANKLQIANNTGVDSANNATGAVVDVTNLWGSAASGTTALLQATITNNNLTNLDTSGTGHVLDVLNSSAGDGETLNLNINGNNTTRGASTAGEIRLRQLAGTFNILGGIGAVSANNNGDTVASTGSFGTVGSVPLPTAPSF